MSWGRPQYTLECFAKSPVSLPHKLHNMGKGGHYPENGGHYSEKGGHYSEKGRHYYEKGG